MHGASDIDKETPLSPQGLVDQGHHPAETDAPDGELDRGFAGSFADRRIGCRLSGSRFRLRFARPGAFRPARTRRQQFAPHPDLDAEGFEMRPRRGSRQSAGLPRARDAGGTPTLRVLQHLRSMQANIEQVYISGRRAYITGSPKGSLVESPRRGLKWRAPEGVFGSEPPEGS